MDHALLGLQLSPNQHQLRSKDRFPLCVENLRPDDQVGCTGLVFQLGEHHAGGRARALPVRDDARHGDVAATLDLAKVIVKYVSELNDQIESAEIQEERGMY